MFGLQPPEQGFGDKVARVMLGLLGSLLIVSGVAVAVLSIILAHGASKFAALAGGGSLIAVGCKLVIFSAVLPHSRGSIERGKITFGQPDPPDDDAPSTPPSVDA
jgi:hypothetical protein